MKTLTKWLFVYPIVFCIAISFVIILSTWAIVIASIIGLFSKNKTIFKISSVTLVISLILTFGSMIY